MHGRKRWLWLAISVSLLAQGCTHYVGFERPSTLSYAEKIPIDVAFFMNETARSRTYEARGWSSGIANSWVIPVGDVAHDYALAYLAEAFRGFREVSLPKAEPPGAFVLSIQAIDYWMEGQAAHSMVYASVTSPRGKEVLNKTYAQDGPSGFGRVLAAGPFAQKSAIRQSTHVVYENIFKSLVADIRAGYRGWTE